MRDAVFLNSLLRAFETEGTEALYSKGDFILRAGDTERHLYSLTSGAVRVLYVSEFEEHTIRLGYTGSLICSLSSFLRESPSEFYVEALRKTHLRSLSREAVLRIAHTDAAHLQAYTALMETLVTQQIDREVDLLTASPPERLRRVLQRSPDLFQEVPLKYIASYLRMSPETLSRLRNS